jgi:hypothetical protein
MVTFEILNNKISSIDAKIRKLNLDKNNLIELRQKVCKHVHIEQSGGGEWWDYATPPKDHGYYPFVLSCLDCGLSGKDDYKQENYKILDDLVNLRRVIKK